MSQRTKNLERRLTGGFSLALGLARYTLGLRAYCRRQIDLREAESIIRHGMKSRNARFMRMLQHSILGYKPSPYRRLLKAAGCEIGDVQRMVASDGVEGALERLHRAGVYVTYEEFKGKAVAVRGSQTFHFNDSDFDNPLVRGDRNSTWC